MGNRLVPAVIGLLALASVWARDLPSTIFAETPAPSPAEIVAPRAMLADEATGKLLVLDPGRARIVQMTAAGDALASWKFDALGLDHPDELQMPSLLPRVFLADADSTLYLVDPGQDTHKVRLVALQGKNGDRTVTLPDMAGEYALTLDASGQMIAAHLRLVPGNATLLLYREGGDGTMAPLTTLERPCGDETDGLVLTSLAAALDGTIAVGIAQVGDKTHCSYGRSWLVQGVAQESTMFAELHVTHHYALLDADGNVLDHFRAAVSLAGKAGYPSLPCVPLFTSLALAGNNTVISGGCTADPFLRVYGPAGALLRSVPRTAAGGQEVALLSDKNGTRIFAADAADGRVEEYTLDGRLVGAFGCPPAYSLAEIASLAAEATGVYAAARWADTWYIVRFSADGRFQWAQPVAPPRSMAAAQPALLTPSGDAVFVGWRVAGAAGVGWVDTLTSDGLPGKPLWDTPFNGGHGVTPPVAPPFVLGKNGRMYVMREMADGTRVLAFSPTGAFLQMFPAEVKSVSLVGADGGLASFRPDPDGTMAADLFSPTGDADGWLTTHRDGTGGVLLPALSVDYWAWLTTTSSLLHFDDTFSITEEDNVLTPGGDRLQEAAAIAGDGAGHLYVGTSGTILSVTTD